MELGTWSILSGPSLIALIPMVVFIILCFFEKIDSLFSGFIAFALGCLICGWGPSQMGDAVLSAMGSTLGLMGFIAALGNGLAVQMNQTGVSKTLCLWIVNRVGINTQKKAIIVSILCVLVVTILLGSMMGAIAICAPILIPVVMAAGLTPSTLAVIFQTAAETGLIWGPFGAPTLIVMEMTALSYGEYMVWAALPFGIIWCIMLYFAAKHINKKTYGVESFEVTAASQTDTAITPQEKITTMAFLITFLALVIFATIKPQSTSYVIFVMLLLYFVITLFGKVPMDVSMKNFKKGMSNGLSIWLLFIVLQCLTSVVDVGGGFTALGNLFTAMGDGLSQTLVMILGATVGAFGINGAAVAQIQITHNLFLDAVTSSGLDMRLWAICLIAASRVTNNIYPNINMFASMGLAQSKNLKWMLFAGWLTAMSAYAWVLIWSILGPMLLG